MPTVTENTRIAEEFIPAAQDYRKTGDFEALEDAVFESPLVRAVASFDQAMTFARKMALDIAAIVSNERDVRTLKGPNLDTLPRRLVGMA